MGVKGETTMNLDRVMNLQIEENWEWFGGLSWRIFGGFLPQAVAGNDTRLLSSTLSFIVVGVAAGRINKREIHLMKIINFYCKNLVTNIWFLSCKNSRSKYDRMAVISFSIEISLGQLCVLINFSLLFVTFICRSVSQE